MFRKVLVANRGEIAVRIIRTCREMGIATVGLYQAPDRGSLHVRLADEVAMLQSPTDFLDQELILSIAQEKQVDAIHAGYGFLAERDDFITLCDQAGIKFIGPPADIVAQVRQKIAVLEQASAAGYPTIPRSDCVYDTAQVESIRHEADHLGYPLVVKSCRGGRGRGERLVWSADRLENALRRAQAEAQTIYDDQRVFLEKALLPAHQIGVQIIGDSQGNLIHMGEREGSLLYGNQKIVEEAPSSCLSAIPRQQILQAALEIARMFGLQNLATVEFLVDQEGHFYFTEIKPRIQIEHALTEILARVDLVREQIRLAWGEPLGYTQQQVSLNGWAMQCRINAEDPWKQFMPSPGHLNKLQLPGGPDVRLDTYLTSGCEIPGEYDPLIAKLVVWGRDRQACRMRMQRALEEIQFSGVPTNLPLIRRIVEQPDFVSGQYATDLLPSAAGDETVDEAFMRNLAAVAALTYVRQSQAFRPVKPERLLSGWHRDSRRLPS
jgi:acetyl-CoA carboxylase biotin carboxylase subunit